MTVRWSIPLIALLTLVLCCALVTIGLAENGEKDQQLTIDQLPPAVQATLKAQAGSGKIEEIELETENGVTFYSADIIQGDKELEVEIAPDGKLIKAEIDDENEDEEPEGDTD